MARLENGMLDTNDNQKACIQGLRAEVADSFDSLAHMFEGKARDNNSNARIENYYSNPSTARALVREANTNETISHRCRRLAQSLRQLING